MHFNLRRAFGIVIPVLFGSALAAGAAALPASAATWQDTALVAHPVQAETFGGASLAAANGAGVIKLSGTGVTWSLHGTVPAGVSLSGTTISYSGGAIASPPSPLTPAIMDPIERLVARQFPTVPVVPVMEAGATDGLFLRNAGIPTYGVSAVFEDQNDVRAHGRDERVGVESFYDALEFWYQMMRAFTSQ